MRIIIIGEFSSFARNLSDGFRKIGHECFVFSWGDGFKNISQSVTSYTITLCKQKSNIPLLSCISLKVKHYISYLRLKRFVGEMSNGEKWDIVLIINPAFIKNRFKFWSPFFTKNMIYSVLNNKEAIFLSACGGDLPYFDYWMRENGKNLEAIKAYYDMYVNSFSISHHKYCSRFINKVIPISYIYAQAWKNSRYGSNFFVFPTIPLPINIDHIKLENELCDKIVIFHGIIRPKDKGSKYITAAMNEIQKKYPERVVVYAKGGMPLNEYLEVLKKTNILIDQVYAYGPGMNALYSLAMGKVVLGGNETEQQKELGFMDVPIINIVPDTNYICNILDELVNNSSRIADLSIKSRKYVEKIHECSIIAQKYIDVFQSYNKY